MAILKKSKKATGKSSSKAKAPAKKASIDLDKLVEEKKTSGTGYQAYIRSMLKKA